MSASHSSRYQNGLLSRLPAVELEKFESKLEHLPLPKGFMIARLDCAIDYVYFLESGIGSIVTVSREGHKAEAGLFGRESFSPVAAAARTDICLHEIEIQSQGHGHRIGLLPFWEALASSQPLANLLVRATHNLATQVSFTALSNAVHEIDERLARWLLMCHDRVDGNEIAITHEYIALMLAVRRPSVTTALHVLEGNRFIRSERGLITIRNRAALEEFAVDAYGKPEEEYQRLFGPLSPSV